MRYKLAIFDLDGTILDTLEDLADSTNYALSVYHMPEHTIDEVRWFVGNGIHKLIERAVPKGSTDEQIEQVFTTFKEYYKDHCAVKTRPYDGIMELLKTLREKGILTAVVSNKGDFAVQILCEDYFRGMFDFAVGEREGIRRKPAPDGPLMVAEKFGVKPEECMYVGDTSTDMQTGKAAGMFTVGALWGFLDRKELNENGADLFSDKPVDLVKICEEHGND